MSRDGDESSALKQSPFRVISVTGADANNLKNIDVEFPLKQISVVTGVSGSGKSSLLADTLAAEGSRRTRIFLGASQRELERDDIRAFVGTQPPTIFIGQRGFRPTVRTTVGTATGFLSVLRRLFIAASTPYSERASETVPSPNPESYAGWISKYYVGLVEIWASPIRQQRTDGVSAVKRLSSNGLKQVVIRSDSDPPRLRECGRTLMVSDFRALNPNVSHTIEALVGTAEVTGITQAKQLKETLARAFPAGNGSVVITLPMATDPDLAGPFGPRLDSKKHRVHPGAPEIFFEPNLHLLSFNAPEHEDSGACRVCAGTGVARRLVESALVPHSNRSMEKGAFAIWTEKNYKYVNVQHETIEGLRGMHGFSPDVPWSKLPPKARALVLNGSGAELVFDRDRKGRKFGQPRRFAGFRKLILEKSASGTKIADQLTPYVQTAVCDSCAGTRWSFQARALRVAGHTVAQILGQTFRTIESFAAPQGDFASAIPSASRALVQVLQMHASSIVSVGLGYLTGDRGMLDVSEGESRRIRLARVLDSNESGFCLLLDEPARGLHESDLLPLSAALQRLRGEHTVILNEHRERLWDAADWMVEIGPGAGDSGGEITYQGAVRKPASNNAGMRHLLSVSPDQQKISIQGASINNVDNVDCEIPLGRLTCICGVSGSGKSSFVRGVLAPALFETVDRESSSFALRHGKWRAISGAGKISEIVALDQAMPPPNRRSLVATYAGVFDDIRSTFGNSPAAKRDGLSPSDFGVNAGEGRCPVCLGIGEIADGDLWSVCPACGGSRYGHAALSVRIAKMNVRDLLDTPVNRIDASITNTFQIPPELTASMCDLGIGYLALGRRIDTLSGGEIQRLRLAMRLSTKSSGSMLFILDEPAVGQHSRDVRQLVAALERVLDGGRNTLVIVEHDLNLIRSADWVLEFGPGSGPNGGKLIFSGTPDRLATRKTPTGLALSGKLLMPKSSLTKATQTFTKKKVKIERESIQATPLIRTLINGDAAAELGSEETLSEPVVAVGESFWSGRELWEVGGLDSEIPKLLLDVCHYTSENLFANVLAQWEREPRRWLAIQPFLTDMQIWGTALPESVVRTTSSHISREGLRLVSKRGELLSKILDGREVRATGERFAPSDNSEEARTSVLHDAFAIGSRYVELRDSSGQVHATASDRLLDLERSVIAPIVPVPSHFSRFDALGCCPMCKGARVVTTVSESLVIKHRNATPDSERFLAPEANAVMKGVRHNELVPFLRRLTKEGLWNSKTTFEKLDQNQRELILFGFWSRPGAGSFLKKPSDNPAEVASWLRWDGLYRHVLDQADRSPHSEWISRLKQSVRRVQCALCLGTGLHRFASVLPCGDLSFADWTLLPDPNRMLKSLRSLDLQTERQRRTRERILYCLSPLAKSRNASTPKSVVERVVESFTTMRTVTGCGSAIN
jgi:excinuclease ABC A subunit